MEAVLLVDDRAPLRQVAARHLENAGLKVFESSSLEEARKVFRRHREQIKAVVADWCLDESDLSNADGVRFANEVKGLEPNVGLVCVSAYHKPDEMAGQQVFDLVYEKAGAKARRFHENIPAIVALIKEKAAQARPPAAPQIKVTIGETTLTLADAMAITTDWEQTNAKRLALIDKTLKGTSTPEEEAELERLQELAGERRNLAMPLPFAELARIEESLRQDGLWPQE